MSAVLREDAIGNRAIIRDSGVTAIHRDVAIFGLGFDV